MDGTQNGTSAAPEGDAQRAEGDDPKPVFQGDWNSATGEEKGRHSERVRQWKLRHGLPVGGRMGARPIQPVPPTGIAATPSGQLPLGDAASRAVLVAIRDNPAAHDSDRIRAVQQLAALDRGEAEGAAGESDLVALRSVLETLAPAERLAWLQGEREEGLAGGHGR